MGSTPIGSTIFKPGSLKAKHPHAGDDVSKTSLAATFYEKEFLMKTEKSLYNDYESLNDDGKELDRIFGEYTCNLFKKYIEKGYSIREISHILINEINCIECECVLIESNKKIKKIGQLK